MNNQQFVQAMYEAFGKGDIPFILNSVSENFTWSDPCNPAIAPQGGIYNGRDGMAVFFKNLGSSVDTTLWEVDDYLAAGDTVVAKGKHGVTVKATGKTHIVDWVMVWDFENGKPAKGKSAFDARSYETCFN